MSLSELAADSFARHPDLTLAALGASDNAQVLDLKPFGVSVVFDRRRILPIWSSAIALPIGMPIPASSRSRAGC